VIRAAVGLFRRYEVQKNAVSGRTLGRIGEDQLTALKAKLEATKAKLQNQDLASLTKDDLIGDLLYTTALTYHAELGVMNHIAAHTMSANAVILPSETTFATKLKVLSLWGIPRLVQAGGLNMDADYLMQLVKAKDGKNETVKQYMLGSGMVSSALEHSVPEQLFSTPGNPAEGVSAVKALKIANEQGIPLYAVNQENISTVLPQLQIDQYVKTDIQNAVNAGKIVTVSKTNISYNGWSGCGYIITNPETGAGAYMLSGGISGGDFSLPTLHPLLLFLIGALLTGVGIFAGLGLGVALAIAAVIVGLYDLISTLLPIYNDSNSLTDDQRDMIVLVLGGIFVVGVIIAVAGVFVGATAALVAVALAWSLISIITCLIVAKIVDFLSSYNTRPQTFRRDGYDRGNGLHWREKQWVV